MIEVEVRSFISQEKYEELLEFFSENADLVKNDFQETHYFDCESDLRIQKGGSYSKVWLKKGKMHDDVREEVEIRLPKEDFDNLGLLFKSLGYGVQVKCFRQRDEFSWKGIKVCIDYTKGYGYIIELEKKIEDIEEKHETLKELENALLELGLEVTPKSIFNEKFEDYVNNWESFFD